MKGYTSVILVVLLNLIFPPDIEAVELIVHPDTPISQVDRNVARGIFSMRMREWADGTPITVFVLTDRNPIHQKFVQSVLAMIPHQLRRSWDRYLYSGIGSPPIQVKNLEEMLSKISATPGAIGYTNEDMNGAEVRKIEVN